MIERDSVQLEKDRIKRRARNKKLGPKPWRWRVARVKRAKIWRRIFWTRKRWARYNDEREIKRNARPRTLKAIRLRWMAEAAAAAAAAERNRLRREAAQRRRDARVRQDGQS